MSDEKNMRPENKKDDEKKHIKPGDIQGKLDVPDTRERRDGPGGN